MISSPTFSLKSSFAKTIPAFNIKIIAATSKICHRLFFFAFLFVYKGIATLFSALNMVSTHRYWWLYLVNGLLLLILGLLFFASPFTAAVSIIFLCAAAFIYWGFSLIFFGYSLRPVEQ